MHKHRNPCALCESDKQVQYLQSHPVKGIHDARYIALTPAAAWALESRNIGYISIEDYQETETREFTEGLIAHQLEWARHADRLLQDTIPSFSQHDFRPALFYLYYLKPSWDTFIHRFRILERFHGDVQPDALVYFRNPEPIRYDMLSGIQGSYTPEIVREWAAARKIHAIELPAVRSDTYWKPHVSYARAFRRTLFEHLPDALKDRIASAFFSRQYGSPANPLRRLAIKPLYDITPEVCRILTEQNIHLVRFEGLCASEEDPSLPGDLTAAWERAVRSDWFFKGSPQPVHPLLEDLYKNFWFHGIQKLWGSFQSAKKNLVDQHIDGIFVPVVYGIPEIGVLMAARSLHIPVIVYQHGANVGEIENTLWDITDRLYSDYHFVYGSAEETYLKSRPTYTGTITDNPVVVGSARLESVFSKARRARMSEKPVVLYIPTILIPNFYMYTYSHPRNIRLFKMRQRIGEIMNGYRDSISFTYKSFFSLGTDPTMEMMDAACPSCRFVADIPLTDLQWTADVLIYEVPGTGLFEGLMTKSPIILFADELVFSLPPDSTNSLQKRVILTRTPEQFYEQLHRLPELIQQYPIENPDQDFVTKFCLDRKECPASLRVSAEMIKILEEPLCSCFI